VRMAIFVVVFVTVMVRFVGVIVAMDVRIVSSAVPMMNQAHDAKTVRRSDSNLPYRPSDLLWQDIRCSLKDTSIRSGPRGIDFPRHRSAPQRLTCRNAKATFNDGVRCRWDAKKRLVRASIRVETRLGGR
jgi:hypothetical protein